MAPPLNLPSGGTGRFRTRGAPRSHPRMGVRKDTAGQRPHPTRTQYHISAATLLNATRRCACGDLSLDDSDNSTRPRGAKPKDKRAPPSAHHRETRAAPRGPWQPVVTSKSNPVRCSQLGGPRELHHQVERWERSRASGQLRAASRSQSSGPRERHH